MSISTKPLPEVAAETLQPVLSERFAFRWRHLFATLLFSLFFMYLNYIPVFHSDIWCHVEYGNWILENGRLPAEDPFQPLAEGMRVVDNAWLSQIMFALAARWDGAHAMSNLFAVVVFSTYMIHARVFYLFSRRIGVAMAGFAILYFVGFSRHAIIRPEIVGGLCFAALLWMLVRLEPWRSRAAAFADSNVAAEKHFPTWLWFAVPALFLFWANTHGSFACGLIVLACHAAGRAIEIGWRQRSITAILADRLFRRFTLLTELALAATLLNPYGIDLLIETARFGGNPNLRDVMEWYPLKLIDLEGIQFSISIVLLIVLLRRSRQRMRATDVLMLLVFAAAVAPTIRMIGWFGPVLTFVLLPHLTNVWRRMPWLREEKSAGEEPPAIPAFPYALTLVSGLIVWSAFALSPISQPVLGGTKRTTEQVHSRMTPHGITEYLRENPPQGLVFAPQWWGDWVVWDGPPDTEVFMTTNLHLAPHRVWNDYLAVARAQGNWTNILDKYNVTTLIVHKELQVTLAREVRRTSRWQIDYEDDLGIVLSRSESP